MEKVNSVCLMPRVNTIFRSNTVTMPIRANPNGSPFATAAICSKDGRHPGDDASLGTVYLSMELGILC